VNGRRPRAPYGAGMHWSVTVAGRPWLVTWSNQDTAPGGVNHGSSGICCTREGIVLVSRDGNHWELPAGRPKGDESPLDTLGREVLEEACCRVEAAQLLGFTTSTCLAGPEEGLILVRAHWAARAVAEPWQPCHEIADRRQVPVGDLMPELTMEPGLEAMWEQIWDQARQAFARL
jgi:8-oxo-dGTP pyrophosphatase MutT (NUDIX family)